GRERFGLRRALVVTQVALSLVLLVGALLFVRSFRNLIASDAGFRQDGVLEADVDFSRLKLSAEASRAFDRELLRQIQAIPGVESAGYINIVPLSGSAWGMDVETDEKRGNSKFARVSPGYFHTMQIALLAGRDFSDRDNASSPLVAVVNQPFVRTYLPQGNPIGLTFQSNVGPKGVPTPYHIVGVVRDSKYFDLRESVAPEAYVPVSQDTDPDAYVPIMIHSGIAPASLIPALKRTLAAMHPEIGYEFQ